MSEMQAVVINEHGGADVLHEAVVPMDTLGPGQVRVRVHAVAVNHLDIWVRKGGPAFSLQMPHRLGSDVAGVIDAVGAGVTEEIGRKVVLNPGVSCMRCQACLAGRDNLCRKYKILGENTQGGYGQFIVVPVENIAPYPSGLSFEEASCVILPFITAWQMLVEKAQVSPGQWVLVQGGASGVGVAAIQIAKLFGAKVMATASTSAKRQLCKELGAKVTIDYTKDDFAKVSRTETGGAGVDVVFEHVGGEVFEKSVKACRNGGVIVTCGATADPKPTLDLRHIFFRQVSVLGSTMASKSVLHKVVTLVGERKLRPVVHSAMPLEKAADAHRMLEERKAVGKVTLTVS